MTGAGGFPTQFHRNDGGTERQKTRAPVGERVLYVDLGVDVASNDITGKRLINIYPEIVLMLLQYLQLFLLPA